MPYTDDKTLIRTLLDQQAVAWNCGDLDAFMQAYWHDPRLRYANGSEVVLGWKPIMTSYRARYRDRALMGRVDFTDLEVEFLSPDAATVFGRFALERTDDPSHGTFTLVLRKLPTEGWRIVSDHTAAAH